MTIQDNLTTDFDNKIGYFGPHKFPNLIICEGFSIIKANGMPFISPIIKDKYWPFLKIVQIWEYKSVKEFLEKLIETGLVTIIDSKLKLLTDECQCIITPDGRLIADENKSGRLTNWISKHYT